MPAIAFEAADLIAIAVLLVLIGFLYATKFTVTPLLSILHSALGWIPGVGGLTIKVENAIITSIDAAIKASEDVLADLLNALKWSFNLVADGLRDLANATDRAIDYVWHTEIARIVKSLIVDVVKDANAALAKVGALTNDLEREVRRLDSKVETTAKATLSSATAAAAGLVHGLELTMVRNFTALENTLRGEIGVAAHGAEAASLRALHAIAVTEDAAIGAIERAQGATAQELREILDDMSPADVAGILAAAAVAIPLVNTIAREAGLEKAECRTKVRSLCTTDLGLFEGLIGTLAIVGVGFNLELIVEAGAKVIEESAEYLAELVS